MTYRIQGVAPPVAEPMFHMTDAVLAQSGARRVIADSPTGFPCRASLEDARPGEALILFNHVSHDVPGPFRTSYAIYMREGVTEAASYVNAVPPVMAVRRLALRCFDEDGMLKDAIIVEPGEADGAIRTLFQSPEVATIHAHNPAYGCFIAKVERD